NLSRLEQTVLSIRGLHQQSGPGRKPCAWNAMYSKVEDAVVLQWLVLDRRLGSSSSDQHRRPAPTHQRPNGTRFVAGCWKGSQLREVQVVCATGNRSVTGRNRRGIGRGANRERRSWRQFASRSVAQNREHRSRGNIGHDVRLEQLTAGRICQQLKG